MSSRADRGRDVVKRTFGGALYQQGRGFYSALELLAILRGEVLLESLEENLGPGGERVLPVEGPTLYLRPTHDHARRLLVANEDVVKGVFADDETRMAVKALLRGIEAPVPGRRRTPDKWQLRHFYPSPAEAIHYDAVARRGKPAVERYQFRGAGGLAHKILRTDPDLDRLTETRAMFRDLLRDSDSAVGVLLTALAARDAVKATGPSVTSHKELLEFAFRDEVEEASLSRPAEAGGEEPFPERWMDLLREGVHRLLERPELSSFERVEGLMHWVPWCIGLHQLAMARRALGKDVDAPIAFDAGHQKSPVRSLARRHLGEATAAIKESLLEAAAQGGLHDLVSGGAAWWKGPRGFFATTMFAVGALNANTGRRHFELKPQLLQAIVHALVEKPIPADRFSSEVLGERLRMVCDRESAAPFGPISVDGRELQRNGEFLTARLDEVGLLRAFSDSNLMVGVHE